MAPNRRCQVCGGAPESTVHLGIDVHGHRYREDRPAPQDGDQCRLGVVWTWRTDIERWFHSSGATMTREQAIERGAEAL